MKYDQLTLSFSRSDDPKHPLLLRTAEGEEEDGVWESPFPPDELAELIEYPVVWGPARTKTLASTRDAVVEDLGRLDIRAVGRRLFRALLPPPLDGLFRACRHSARRNGRGVRLELSFDPEDPSQLRLYSLPWELLHDGRDFLSLSRRMSVVRRLRVREPEAMKPLALERLRVLAVLLPDERETLDLAEEARRLQEIGRDAPQASSRLEVETLVEPDMEELVTRLEEGSFSVLHLMGHGSWNEDSEEWGLSFAAGHGGAAHLPASVLATQLNRFSDSLRLVVLNSCRSGRAVQPGKTTADAGVATALVQRGAVSVVAMQGPISDRAAITFAESFYRRLAAGRTVDEALEAARLTVHSLEWQSGSRMGEWATPVWLRRGDAPFFRFLEQQPANGEPVPPYSALAAMVAGLLGTAGLALNAALALAWPEELATAAREASKVLGFGALAFVAWMRTWHRERHMLSSFATWLRLHPLRMTALWCLPLLALGIWFLWGQERMRDLPCLEACGFADTRRSWVGIDLSPLSPPVESSLLLELRRLLELHRLVPRDLGDPSTPGDQCLAWSIVFSAPTDGSAIEIAIFRRGLLQETVHEPGDLKEPSPRTRIVNSVARALGLPWNDRLSGIRDPGSPSYQARQNALRLYRQGETQAAADLLDSALSQDPDEPLLQQELALLLVDLASGMEFAPKTLQPHLEQAQHTMLLRAESLLRTLLLKPSGHAEQALGLATIMELQGKPAEAKQAYRQALVLQPSHAIAGNNLATLLLDQGKAAEAQEHLTRAWRASSPKHPGVRAAILKNQARAALVEGNFQEAWLKVGEALELVPAEAVRLRPEILYYQAHLATRSTPSAACASWERYLALAYLDPVPERHEEALKWLFTQCPARAKLTQDWSTFRQMRE